MELRNSKEIGTFKDFCKVGDNFVFINDTKIEFRANDYNLTLLKSNSRVTEGELFVNPTNVVYNALSNKLIILDNKLVYIFNVEDDYSITLTHYWGGVGEKTSRTRLNDPVDIHTNSNDIFIVDADSGNIKIYNGFLNWKNQISLSEWNTDNYPVSITSSDDRYFVLTSAGIVYVLNSSYEYVSEFSTVNGQKIYHNDGLIYVHDLGTVHVYMNNGVYLNIVQLDTDINKLFFDGNEVYGLNNFSMIKFIDFVSIKSIKNTSNVVCPLASILVNGDEPVTDFVFNDSINKLHKNLLNLANSLVSKFVINIDEFDQFLSYEIKAIADAEHLLENSGYEAIGINEIVSYETINRSLSNIWEDMELLRQMIDVRKSRIVDGSICWTWKGQSIAKAQNLSNNRKPFSWKELKKEATTFNTLLSSIVWKTAKSCAYESNLSPICWTWEQMSNDCIWNKTWEELEQGKTFAHTWEQIEENCCDVPQYTFNDCLTGCV
jgi:hypothetical protein